MTEQAKRNYCLLSGALLTFFLTWSFTFSIYSIWLEQALGLSGEERGIVFSLGAFCALFILPAYGYLQDKLGLKKTLLYFVALMLVFCGPFSIFVYAPLLAFNVWYGALAGGLYFALAFGAGVGALETYVERVGRVTGFEFGKARMWGSVGWAVATFFTGRLFNLDPNINFCLASVTGTAFLIFVALVRPANTAQQEELFSQKAAALKISDALGLFSNPKFLALGLYVIGVTTVYAVYDQQFPSYFASVFSSRQEGNAMYGYLNSLQVFLEAGGLFLAPKLVNRIGAKQGLIVAGCIMAVRILGSGYADDAISISAMKLLHAAELPIMLVAMFKYIAANFDARLSATIYLVGFAFMTQIGASALSILAGIMYDTLGFAASYKIFGLIVCAFVIISHFVLSNDKNNIASVGLDQNTDADVLPPHDIKNDDVMTLNDNSKPG